MSPASCQLLHSRLKMEVTEEFESSRTAYEAVGQPMGATDEWWWGWILRVLGLDDLSENESNRIPFRLAGKVGVEPTPADLESAVLP